MLPDELACHDARGVSLNTASNRDAANVDSCMSTTAPAASRDTAIDGIARVPEQTQTPTVDRTPTPVGWIHDVSFNCTDSPFFKRLYAGPGGSPSAVAFSTSMRPDGILFDDVSETRHCVVVGRANDDTALGASERSQPEFFEGSR